MESQADALGAQVMNDSGYDPHYMAQFFETLQRAGGKGTMQFLSDHPNPGNREKAIDAEIPTLGGSAAYHNDSSEFHNVQSRLCDGISPLGQKPFARSAASHFASSSANTPADMAEIERTLKFQGIELRFPAEWRALGAETSELTLVPKDGLATAHDQPALVRGVIISTFDPSHRTTLEQETQELVQQLHVSNPELRSLSGQHASVLLAGVSGESVQLVNRNPEGQPEHDNLMTFPRSDGSLLYFIFVAPESEFGRYGPVFDRILNSVKIAQ
jgi:hypothetical protein